MYPDVIFEGFRKGLGQEPMTLGSIPYDPYTQEIQYRWWLDGYYAAIFMVRQGMAHKSGNPLYVAQCLALTRTHAVSLTFLNEGYHLVGFRSRFDRSGTCEYCGKEMIMRAFEKDTPDGPRPASYRVVGQCPCGYIEEF